MDAEQTAEFYRSRGFAARIGFGHRPALLIVDFIRGFTEPSSPLASDYGNELAAAAALLRAARRAGLLVNYTTLEYAENLADGGTFIKKIPSLAVLRRGSELTQIEPRLEPLPGEIIWSKKGASAFFGTALAATLTAAGVDTVIIAGCTTSGCIRASAVDSCQHGFRTIVVREAVGDRAPGPHAANLFDIDAKYGDVVTLEEALRYLGRFERATTPE